MCPLPPALPGSRQAILAACLSSGSLLLPVKIFIQVFIQFPQWRLRRHLFLGKPNRPSKFLKASSLAISTSV
ncbi:hypothetical protein DK842_22765 (plasmid) [Chromobacterium phragmitis]|nr:hypothetical protein DK842_22765 [Chromobacterium phragmitis]